MRIYLIRHGMTEGNREHRYVGSTDEGLLEDAKEFLREKHSKEWSFLREVNWVCVSPMLRCIQTAELLFPDRKFRSVSDFRECDFGRFEYKNYEELNGDADYQRFIDTMGRSGFPGGESKESFQKRCVMGFSRLMDEIWNERMVDKEWQGQELSGVINRKMQDRSLALVVHGGTIMAILEALAVPHRDYYDWQIGTGEGFVAEVFLREESIRGGNDSDPKRWKLSEVHRI